MSREKRSKRKDTATANPPITDPPAVKADGTPKAVKSDGSVDRRGGPRPGSGRKPIHDRLTNYNKAIKMLDDSIEGALQVLIDGLEDEDKYYRKACAELLLKKSLADKKHTEHTGLNGGPVQISAVDIENAVKRVDSMVQARIEGRDVVEADFRVEED